MSDKFGKADAKRALGMKFKADRDDLVSRCNFYYDNLVRRRSDIRGLRFNSSTVTKFNNNLEPGFTPDFKTCALLCETPEDAASLADVCGRVIHCTYLTDPSKKMSSAVAKLYHGSQEKISPAVHDCSRSWMASYRNAFRDAMQGVYDVLQEKSPDLTASFVNHLDTQSYRCLSGALEGKAVLPEKARNASAWAGLTGYESGEKFYDSSSDNMMYVSLNRVLCGRSMHAMDLQTFTEGYDSRLYMAYTNIARRYVNNFFREINPAHFPKTETVIPFAGYSTDKPQYRPMDANSIFYSMSCNPSVMERQLPMLVQFCNQAYANCEPAAKQVVANSRTSRALYDISKNKAAYVKNSEYLFENCHEHLQSTCISQFSVIYDGLSETDEKLAVNFVNGLSDDVYSDLCNRRADIAVTCPREHSVQFTPRSHGSTKRSISAADFDKLALEEARSPDKGRERRKTAVYWQPPAAKLEAPVVRQSRPARQTSQVPRVPTPERSPESAKLKPVREIMDPAGLLQNTGLNPRRTAALLKANDYRELLSQCMYHYEYDACSRSNEIAAFMAKGFDGKAPNETFAHIASNCRNVNDVQALARAVNIACRVCDDSDVLNGSLRDDVTHILFDKNGFKSHGLQVAFAKGLSQESVKALDIKSFMHVRGDCDGQVCKNLSKQPVTCSDSDIICAKQSGFYGNRYFSETSASQIMRRAVNSAYDDLRDAGKPVFSDIGKLATACCAEYVSEHDGSRPRIGLHTIMAAGDSAEDMRSAAKVCNLAFDALQSDSKLSPFKSLSDSQRDGLKSQMQKDVQKAYGQLTGTQKAKFVSGLYSPAREEILSQLPGAWSNGVNLKNIPKKLSPPPGYANRLGVFAKPDFEKPVDNIKHPVFVSYQANLDRGRQIRSTVRTCSKIESDNPDARAEAVDARSELLASCLSTYQKYGQMAVAEHEGREYNASSSTPTYSLHELAEQCDCGSNVNVLIDVYTGVADSISKLDKNSVERNAMEYALKVDTARSAAFLNAYGLGGYFDHVVQGTVYESRVARAEADMPVYVNKDETAFMGRSRPKSAKDIYGKIDTVSCIKAMYIGLGMQDKIPEVDAAMAAYNESKPAERFVGDMQLSEPSGETAKACSL